MRSARQGGSFGKGTRTWVPCNVGGSGLGTNPTNPWYQHPRRPPIRKFIALSRKRPPEMTWSRSMQIVGVMAGFGGLLRGLFRLEVEPLFAVLEVLGAMTLLLKSVAGVLERSWKGPF